jgi:DNA-binding NarL/FixJ family response regulator
MALSTTVVLIEDHSLFRKGLRMMLEEQTACRVVAEAADRPGGLDAVLRCQPALAFVDLGLGGENGLELIKDLHAHCPATLLIVLSMHEEEIYAQRALHAGARAYIQKSEVDQVVIEAMRTVLEGRIWLSPALRDRLLLDLFSGRKAEHESLLARLSDRELEVFSLIGKGFGSQEIAARLNLSVKTIHSHRENLKQKLGCAGSQELRILAIEWKDTLGR